MDTLNDAEKVLLENLDKLAIPEIYRNNSFQKLSMPINATYKDITKRQQIVEISIKTGAEVVPGSGVNYQFITKISDNFELEETIQKVKNPVQRLLEEFFWFWPLDPQNGAQDPVLILLQQGKKTEAVKYWSSIVRNNSNNGIAIHNLGIIHHIDILEKEFGLLSGSGSNNGTESLNTEWKSCLKYWKQLSENEDFWSHLADRVRVLDDPRLTTGVVRRLRSSLPYLMALILVRLIIRFNESHLPNEAERLIVFFEEDAKFAINVRKKALKSGLSPLQNRIQLLCDAVKTELTNDPLRGEQVVKNLINKCNPLLKTLDFFDDFENDGNIHDLLTETCISSMDAYMRVTDDWESGVSILNVLSKNELSASTLEKLNNTVNALNKAIHNGNKWFGVNYYKLPSAAIEVLEEAKSQVEKKEYQNAIQMIQQFFVGNETSLSDDHKRTINVALAYCHNEYATYSFGNVMGEIEKSRTAQNRTAERFNSGSGDEISLLLSAIQNRTLQEGAWYFKCMACGRRIYRFSDCHPVKINDLTYFLCEMCFLLDKDELQSRMNKLKQCLLKCRELLILAIELNPLNKAAKENLDSTYEIAGNSGISLPRKTPIISAASSINAHRKIKSGQEKEPPFGCSTILKSRFVQSILVVTFILAIILFYILANSSRLTYCLSTHHDSNSYYTYSDNHHDSITNPDVNNHPDQDKNTYSCSNCKSLYIMV